MPRPGPTHAADLSPLVRFVLRHVQVQATGGSRQKWEHGYTLEPRVVRSHNLLHVTRGRPVWVVEGEELPLSPGDLLIVPPGPRHHAYCRTRRITLFSLHVDATLPGGRSVFDLLSPPRLQRVAPGTHLDRYLRHAIGEYDRPTSDQTVATMHAWADLIVRELLLATAARGDLRENALDPVVAATLEELQRRIAQSTTLDDLAARAGYTPQHLNRVFRRALGVTPLQHLARLRVEHAAALLREGRLTVAAVAARCGFTDPYYFSRVFHAHTGRSPARYRDEAGSDSPSASSGDPWRARPGPR